MIKKKNIWFVILSSLVIVLSIYYVTIPEEMLLTNELPKVTETKVVAEESSSLVALRVSAEEEYLDEVESLTSILTNGKSSIDEKNNAYEQMKNLNSKKGEQEELEKMILDEFKLKSFVKIDGTQIKVIIDSEKHDVSLANKIMRCVQGKYENKMSITVKFQGN